MGPRRRGLRRGRRSRRREGRSGARSTWASSLIDTADAYGGGEMERLVGKLLKDHPDLVVVTKGGDRSRHRSRREVFRRRLPAQRRRALAASGSASRRSRSYLLHHPTPDTLHGGEAVETMEALKKEGKIQHWGVCRGRRGRRARRDRQRRRGHRARLQPHAPDRSPPHLRRRHGRGLRHPRAQRRSRYGLLAGMWAKDRDVRRGRSPRRALDAHGARAPHRAARRGALPREGRRPHAARRGRALRAREPPRLGGGPRPAHVEQLEQLVRETGGGPRYLPDDDLRQLPRALDKRRDPLDDRIDRQDVLAQAPRRGARAPPSS